MRIQRFNESYFLAATPALDLLFAINSRVWVKEAFVVCESRQVVSAGEPGNNSVLMLKHPAAQVTRNASVEHVRARTVCHDVNVKLFGLPHNSTHRRRHPEARRSLAE